MGHSRLNRKWLTERPESHQVWDAGKPPYMKPIYDALIGHVMNAIDTKQDLNDRAFAIFGLLAGFGPTPASEWELAKQKLTAAGRKAGLDHWEITEILREAQKDGKEKPLWMEPIKRHQAIDGTIVKPPKDSPRSHQFVLSALTEKPGMLRKELLREGKERGFSEPALKRAMAALGVLTQTVEGGKDNAKRCYLPVGSLDNTVGSLDKIVDNTVGSLDNILTVSNMLPVGSVGSPALIPNRSNATDPTQSFAGTSQGNYKSDPTEVIQPAAEPWDTWDGHSDTWPAS